MPELRDDSVSQSQSRYKRTTSTPARFEPLTSVSLQSPSATDLPPPFAGAASQSRSKRTTSTPARFNDFTLTSSNPHSGRRVSSERGRPAVTPRMPELRDDYVSQSQSRYKRTTSTPARFETLTSVSLQSPSATDLPPPFAGAASQSRSKRTTS
eukprot:1005682_1